MSENRPFVIARETICWSSEQYPGAFCAAVVAVAPANANAKRMRRFAIARPPSSALFRGRRRAVAPRPGVTSILAAGSSALRARGPVEGGAQSLGELDCIVVGPEVHEDETRLLGQHVAVHRRHLNAVFAERLDHRVDLVARQHEVAGDGGLAAAGRLEADGRGHTRRARG